MRKNIVYILTLAFLSFVPDAFADGADGNCYDDNACISSLLEETLENLENKSWRDQGYRDLAEMYVLQNRPGEALNAIAKINNPDTRAMAIRKSATAVSEIEVTDPEKTIMFEMFEQASKAIQHHPSMEIALTYLSIAMAEAGLFEEAVNAVPDITNVSLRNKAYAEIAEVQARHKNGTLAIQNIKKIETESFRNQAAKRVAGVLAEHNDFKSAVQITEIISNSAHKAAALQGILGLRIQKNKGEK